MHFVLFIPKCLQHNNITQNLRLSFYVNLYDFILITGRNYDSKKAANESKYYSKFNGTIVSNMIHNKVTLS